MKKGRLMAFALAAGITLMGAGYAQWNDAVTINATVNTGIVDVDFAQVQSQSDNLNGQITTDANLVNLGSETDGSNNDVFTITTLNLTPGIYTDEFNMVNKSDYAVSATSFNYAQINQNGVTCSIEYQTTGANGGSTWLPIPSTITLGNTNTTNTMRLRVIITVSEDNESQNETGTVTISPLFTIAPTL
jgi:hypothetical protein